MKHFESLAEEREYKQKQEELRDWFAGQVIAGSFSGTCGSSPIALAKEAYAIADAMMRARQCSDDS